jgi:hypothetical protein
MTKMGDKSQTIPSNLQMLKLTSLSISTPVCFIQLGLVFLGIIDKTEVVFNENDCVTIQ